MPKQKIRDITECSVCPKSGTRYCWIECSRKRELSQSIDLRFARSQQVFRLASHLWFSFCAAIQTLGLLVYLLRLPKNKRRSSRLGLIKLEAGQLITFPFFFLWKPSTTMSSELRYIFSATTFLARVMKSEEHARFFRRQ